MLLSLPLAPFDFSPVSSVPCSPLPHPVCFWPAALTPCRTRSSSSIWPSRAGPRAGPSPLRSASAHRRRRGSPRRAARAREPGSDPPIPLLDLRVVLRARGPVGPAATSADAQLWPPQGGTCLPPGHYPPPPVGGGAGSDVVPLWQLSCWPGADGLGGTCPSLPLSSMRSWPGCNTQSHSYHPSGDKQVSPDKSSPSNHCVIVSRGRGSPDRVESYFRKQNYQK